MTLEIFLATAPGLEPLLAEEARAADFAEVAETAGGVTVTGGWPEVWRANLVLRGAARVLVRIGGFHAAHLAQLDKRATKFPWAETLRPDRPVRVEVTTRRSKIYHAGAAQQRIEGGLSAGGIRVDPEAGIVLKTRIENDFVRFSLESSGAPLHRRGFKQAVGKAPMRETLAALFLRACGYDGEEPVLDPMCGSGTFVLEAAEIAAGLPPGRARRFAFEDFASFDPAAWDEMRRSAPAPAGPPRFYGSDRDQGAVQGAAANAERAGVAPLCSFTCRPVSELARPDGAPGLVIVNPPYGTRVGNKKLLYAIHGALGEVLKTRFSGWRVGLVTSDKALARATALPFRPPGPPVPHGGLKVQLWQTGPLR
ncbi:THUMP domain-containing class I SAM-dependent RNA methyltransferase [Roseivivax sediminis]|uniref:Putative N6-adenine-specific DNA methylase n=1 Tax=Roseivivax sediminis TaxID=936889 RepID=A0A1I1ZDL1_9RHOB|nr:class I SAM-dependent RNA methyltransferase [Roseivivax sediminis]SFE29672.1 putative N6-adenine-specific DNA methylase [Roseivivax sediminis]